MAAVLASDAFHFPSQLRGPLPKEVRPSQQQVASKIQVSLEQVEPAILPKPHASLAPIESFLQRGDLMDSICQTHKWINIPLTLDMCEAIGKFKGYLSIPSILQFFVIKMRDAS